MRSQAETRWRNECADQLQQVGLDAAADEFRECGNIYGVLACGRDHSHFQALAVHTCKLRFCPICARKLSQKLMDRYLPAIKKAVEGSPRKFSFKMINLTTNISLYDADVIEKTKQMYRRVSDLFDNLLGEGRSGWSQKSNKRYTGEGYLVAAEFGEGGRKLHFHCLFFGRYIPQATLSDEWKAITGFPIVHISKIKEGLKRGLKETLKYISKFEKATAGDYRGYARPEEIARLAQVFNKLRRVRTRGLFYNLPSESEIAEQDIDARPVVCPECLSILVTFEPSHWDKMHPEMKCRQLHLKRETKFLQRDKAPPGYPGFKSDFNRRI